MTMKRSREPSASRAASRVPRAAAIVRPPLSGVAMFEFAPADQKRRSRRSM